MLRGAVDEPEPELGLVVGVPGVVDEPGVVDDGDVVDEPLVVPGSHGGATCPGAEPACGSLCTRPEFVEFGLLRALVPACVVDEPLRLVVALMPLDDPLCVFVDGEPLPDDVRPDAEPLPFAGVQGTCVVVLEGVDGVCPLEDPVVELCAAAYPPTESAAAKANALIVVTYGFMCSCSSDAVGSGGNLDTSLDAR